MAVKLGRVQYIRTEVNPQKKKRVVKKRNSSTASQKRLRRSKGEKPMAKKNRARKSGTSKPRRTRSRSKASAPRRSNPFTKSHRSRSRRRRRNPGGEVRVVRRASKSAFGAAVSLIRFGALAFGAGMATREGTQAVLKDRNRGMVGYAGNFAAALLLAYLAKTFGSRGDVFAVTAGAGLSILERFRSEMANQVVAAQGLSGLGDAGTFVAGQRIRRHLAGLAAVPSTPRLAVTASPMTRYQAPGRPRINTVATAA